MLLFFIRAGSRVQNSPQRCHRHRRLDAICECEVGKKWAAVKWFINNKEVVEDAFCCEENKDNVCVF